MASSVLFVSLAIVSALKAPPQTPVQQQVLARALAQAKPASAQAENAVLQLFNSSLTRQYLRQFDDGSGLFNLAPSVLMEKFWTALSFAEVVHSFGDLNPHAANCGFDMSIGIGEQSGFFYNQWQLQALKYVPVDPTNNPFPEGSETKLFGFPPFKNVSDPDIATATDRIVYGAVNMYRGSGGNPQCGPIAAVFSRSYLSDSNILVAPFDTGFFTGVCNNTSEAPDFGNSTVGVCGAWGEAHPLGNPPYLSHLLLPYLTFWNESAPAVGSDYIYLNLARLLTRLLSRNTYSPGGNALALNFVENTLGYLEFNYAVGIDLPNGVKMMVGMFELLWGTEEGDLLRSWCVSEGWPLAWAYNPIMSFTRCGPDGKFPGCIYPANVSQGIDTASARVLDPLVLAQVPSGHNVSLPSGLLASFETIWQNTNATATSRAQLEVVWNSLENVFSELLVEPLFPGACVDDCAAVFVNSQACVC